MKKYIYTVIVLSIFFIAQTKAQNTQAFQWVQSGGGAGDIYSNGYDDETIKNMGTDDNGNIYAVSVLTSYGTYIDTVYSSGFGRDDFAVVSYTCNGGLRWVKRFGNVHDDGAMDIVVDNQGNSYVSGSVLVSDLGPAHFGDSTIVVGDTISKANFIIKLDSLGNITWLSLPGPDNYNGFPVHYYTEIEFGSNGNPYVFARFMGSCTYNGFAVPDSGEYVLEFDKQTGDLLNMIDLQTENANLFGKYCTIDKDDNIFILYNVPYDYMVIGNDTIAMSSGELGKQVLASYNMNGDLNWKLATYGVYGDTINTQGDIYGKPAVDDNYIYLPGNILRTYPGATFMGFPINNPVASGQNIRTHFYVRIDKNTGEINKVIGLWNYEQILSSVICVRNGKIYAAGQGGSTIVYNQTDTIQPNAGTTIGDQYPYVLEIDTSFESFNWGVAAQATDVTRVRSIHADKNGNVYIGGHLLGTITDSYGNIASSHGNEDFFIAKIATDNLCVCKSSEPTLSVQSFQNNELVVTGAFQNIADSAYIDWGDGTVSEYTQYGTNATHTYPNNGPYTVCLQGHNHCGMDEDCEIDLLHSDEDIDISQLKLYPNPTSENVTIEIPDEFLGSRILVQTIDGRIIHERIATKQNNEISLSKDKTGIYLIKLINTDGNGCTWRVIKQ